VIYVIFKTLVTNILWRINKALVIMALGCYDSIKLWSITKFIP